MSDSKKRRKKRIVALVTTLMEGLVLLLKKNKTSVHSRRKFRKSNIYRTRAKIVNLRRCLGKTFFRRAYRMSEDKFTRLVEILKPYLPTKLRVGPNGTIPVDLELSIALRYFAGGSPLDFIASHGISHTSIWNSIWRIVVAINKCEELKIRFPENHEIQRQLFCIVNFIFQHINFIHNFFNICLEPITVSIQPIKFRIENHRIV